MTPRKRPQKRETPTFSIVKATPPLTKELIRRLKTLPTSPSPINQRRNWGFALQSLAEYLAQAPPLLARLHGRLISYPAPFRRVHFPSSDGTALTAWLGVQKDPRGRPLAREAVLMVPGMFTTKDNGFHRARAVRFFREWGYHVLSLDLRGMGESDRAFNTAGWKESYDLEAALEFLRGHCPTEKVHIYAESLGAVAAILAAARQAKRGFRLVDGAILAISPFPDARRMIDHLVEAPHPGERLPIVQWFFTRLLELGGKRYPDFRAYLKAAAKAYGVTLAELYRRSTVRTVIQDVNVPLLIVLGGEDPIVPDHEQDLFVRSLRGRANPAILRLPWGSHCLFEIADPTWYWNLLHEFFDFYCVLPSPRSTAARRPSRKSF